MSDHDELRRTGLISGRSSCPHHTSAAARRGRLPGPPQGLLSRAHRIRSPLLPFLVRRARPGPAGCAAPASGVVHPLDAGDPPVQALHRLPALLGRGRFLPHLRHRRPPGALAQHVRRPTVPAESPTLGFTHLQFEARHADPRTTMRYDKARELRQLREKPQVSRSRPCRRSVPPGSSRLTRQLSRAVPSDTGSVRWKGRSRSEGSVQAHRGREGVAWLGSGAQATYSDSSNTRLCRYT